MGVGRARLSSNSGDLSPAVRVTLAAFLDAVVIVDPAQYQSRPASLAIHPVTLCH